MTPQERDIIGGLFDKVKTSIPRERDPEADRFIADQLSANPGAAYAMAQTIYAQDEMMRQMHAAIEDLQHQVNDLRSRPQQGGGFLSGLFGGSRQPEPRPMQRPAGMPGMPGMPAAPMAPGGFGQPAASPWGARQAAPGGGGGFLAGALSTAAGVAGGMLLANAVMGAFGGDEAQAAGAEEDKSAAEDNGGDDFGGDFDSGEF